MRGFHKLWVIGDNFLAETYRKFFKKAGSEFYMKDKFEVIPFCSSRFSDKNLNAVSRIINSFIAAVNSKTYLPMYIVIVLDDDLIEYLQYKKYGVSSMYRSWIEHIAKEITNVIDQRKQDLPPAALLDDAPQIYWVEPVNHVNFDADNKQMREKFGACLDSVSKIFSNMRCLKIRNPWDKNDANLVINNRITKNGLSVYWKTIDASFSFNVKKREEFLIRSKYRAIRAKSVPAMKPVQEDANLCASAGIPDFFKRPATNQDRFHWRRQNSNSAVTPRFLLPRPQHK